MLPIYNIDFRKLALMLLPNIFRKQLLFAFVRSAIMPIKSLHERFIDNYQETDVYIRTTPQVCYIVALLNKTFLAPDSEETFVIVDTEPVVGEWIMTYDENYDGNEDSVSDYSDIIPLIDVNDYTIFYTEAAILEVLEDFIVLYPQESMISYNNDRYKQMRSIVDKYRLASKQPRYELLTI